MKLSRNNLLLALCFLGSGATSLSLEVAWSKELSYLLGVDLYASTTVVTAFMAGLGLGAMLVARFYRWERASLRAYAILQIGIGVCGLVSVPLFRSTLPLFSLLYNTLSFSGGLFMFARFLVVFGLMMVPVTLMGMTLPIVVGATYGEGKGRFASAAGLFYGINTVGAFAGTLMSGFFLIPAFGILKTCIITGVIDLVIAAIAFGIHLNLKRGESHRLSDSEKNRKAGKTRFGTRQPASGFWSSSVVIGSVFLISGMVALSLEICWFRLLVQVIGPSVHAFSIMLAVYLAGIGLGSLVGSRWALTVTGARQLMGILLWGMGLVALGVLFYVNHLPVWYARLTLAVHQQVFSIWNLLVQGVVAALLVLPATVLMGMLFPVVIRAYNDAAGRSAERHMESSVGRLYFLNTLGGVAGCLLTGFWLIPRIGVHPCLLLACGLTMILALVVLATSPGVGISRKLVQSAGVAVTAGIMLLTLPGRDQLVYNIGVYAEMFTDHFERHIADKKQSVTPGRLLFVREGINNTVAVMANTFEDGNLTLHLSGHWVATTEFHGRIHLHFLGHLPMLFARHNTRAAVIGFGTGITSGALLQYPQLERLDIFEIEPGVIEAARYFDYINNRPLDDPRTRLITEDGRSQLTYNDDLYDVITADPIHPFVAGAGNLYSEDFYKLARSRLKSGGIFCQWIPLSSISLRSYNAILGTLHRVFPHTALFSCFGESIVLASADPIRVPWKEFESRFFEEAVFRDFEAIDIRTPFNLVLFYEGGGAQIDGYLAANPSVVNTDDNVWIEHHMPTEGFDLSLTTLIDTLRRKIPGDPRQSIQSILPGIPFSRMETELAAISARNTEHNVNKAQQAFEQNDVAAMDEYNRRVFSDISSEHYYAAGMMMVSNMLSSGQDRNAVRILKQLQRKHPAFAEPYRLEAAIYVRGGFLEKARDTVRRGLMFIPANLDLLQLKRKLGA